MNTENNTNPVVQQVLEKRKPEHIKVADFVEKYESYPTELSQNKYLSATIKIRKYVDYATKVAIANQIIKQSCFDKQGNIRIDSIYKYFLYIVSIISLYTNLEMDATNSASDYDMLDKNGLIEKIVNLIPENELAEYRTIVQMAYDDCMTNNYDIRAMVNKMILSIQPIISTNLNEFLDKLSLELNSLDNKFTEHKK